MREPSAVREGAVLRLKPGGDGSDIGKDSSVRLRELTVPHATAVSIDDLFAGLSRKLVNNQLSLGPIVTRVLLRTGVNLRSPRPDQVKDPAAIAKVTAVLAELGYPL